MGEFDAIIGCVVRWICCTLGVAALFVWGVDFAWRRLPQAARVAVVMIAAHWKNYDEWRRDRKPKDPNHA